MDNKTAFWLALIILCIFVADWFLYDWALIMHVGRLIARASDWLAIWR